VLHNSSNITDFDQNISTKRRGVNIGHPPHPRDLRRPPAFTLITCDTGSSSSRRTPDGRGYVPVWGRLADQQWGGADTSHRRSLRVRRRRAGDPVNPRGRCSSSGLLYPQYRPRWPACQPSCSS
jgi:hypothetical protein